VSLEWPGTTKGLAAYSVVAFIVTVQLAEKSVYRKVGKVMVTVRMIQYRTVVVKLMVPRRSHPMRPSQPGEAWAASTVA
jgi:hypothetical protein